MKIGIDGFPFLKNPSGIGKYLLSLVKMLMETYPDAEFIFYANREICLPEEMYQRAIIKRDISLWKRLNSTVWLKIVAGRIIKNDHIDYYLSGAGFLPKLENRTKKLVVVHDINYKIVPQAMGRLNYLSHLAFLKRDVKKADFIITNSHGTSDKIRTYFSKEADTIINPPTESRFKKMASQETNSVLRKYNIDYPYFLTVGTLEPRKNLALTIETFLHLLQKGKTENYKLVIVGSKGWKDSEIIRLCEQYKDSIIRLGYVEENDLPALYNGTKAFLFPSIYEGFGMPAREALYCGCTVITSDLDELKESSHNQAIFINPNHSEEYERAIEETLLGGSAKPFFENFKREESDVSTFLNYFAHGKKLMDKKRL